MRASTSDPRLGIGGKSPRERLLEAHGFVKRGPHWYSLDFTTQGRNGAVTGAEIYRVSALLGMPMPKLAELLGYGPAVCEIADKTLISNAVLWGER